MKTKRNIYSLLKILSFCIAIFLLGCSKPETPKLWVWSNFYDNYSDLQWDSLLKKMSDHGITGLLLMADTAQLKHVIPMAKKYDIQVHAWMWTMNRNDAPKEWMSINALGYSLADSIAYVEYYKFMSPALPEVQQFIKNKVEELSKVEGLSGVHLDYIRYVDCILPIKLQPKYGLKQDSIMPQFDYDYHPKMRELYKAKYNIDPLFLPDKATNQQWIQFRMDKISDLVNSLPEITQTQKIKISAAVFSSPEIARDMVRQDWTKWNLNYFFPMVYHNFYGKDISWIGKVVEEDVKAVPNSKVICGLFLPGFKDTKELKSAIQIAFKNGASGVSFFNLDAISEEDWKMLKNL